MTPSRRCTAAGLQSSVTERGNDMLFKPIRTLALVSGVLLSSTILGLVPAAAFDLAVAAGADPVSLDPRKTWVAQGYSINAHVFEPLVFRTEKDGNVQLVPVLAESWTCSSPTELEVKIREGVSSKWRAARRQRRCLHDHQHPGREVRYNLKLWTRETSARCHPVYAGTKTKSATRGSQRRRCRRGT